MKRMQGCFALLVAALLAGPAIAADDETARMIADLGLIEASKPVRESAQWKKPERILVRDATPERIEWMKEVAPGVQFTSVNSPADAAAKAGDADAVFGYCTSEILEAGKQIRWIQVYFAGVENCLAVPALQQRTILLTNMQKVAGDVMAEHVMAMVLSFSRGLNVYRDAQNRSEWTPRTELVGTGRAFALEGKTMFVAGLGGIGSEVARRANAMGMKVIATRASNRPAPPYVSRVGPPGDLIAMAREADIVVNTLPLTDETRGVFNAAAFAAMKPSAYFFNVGRGRTVVTADLVSALQSKKLAGAGLDVTDPEPLPADHVLWKMSNVIITPHVSADLEPGVGMDSRWLLVRENLRRYVAGEKMLSVVDPARGY
jgi:phosphoglycerate dehydrogenase-like enzyme